MDGPALATATGGRLVVQGRLPVRGAAVDSRRVQPGNAFFALPGERTDGHRFLAQAVAAGAAALVVREAPAGEELAALAGGDAGGPAVSVVAVDDAAVALRAAAAAWRDRFSPLVVGITGSLAKTSTKEQLAEVLATRRVVLRNVANENNEIGLPLTLMRMGPEHEVAVLEMGLYTRGDIALLAALARPSIGVVTAVRGVHLERAGSIDAIEAGKRELVEALPAPGWAVLNADDERVLRMRERAPCHVLTYGFSAAADVRAEDVVSLGEAGMRFRLRLPDGAAEVRAAALGRHSVHNALAAAAVASLSGLDLGDIARGLLRPVRAPHRTQLRRAGAWRILDDSYNASPDAMVAALELLAELPGRHVAVLGEMRELGAAADEQHRAVGRRAASLADVLVVVGEAAAWLAEGAREAGMAPSAVRLVADREAALGHLLAELRPGDTVLVKASRGVELDRIVAALERAAAPVGAQA
jgi:UDP-N-acetylmuramoyl-tripeptide--D-alanyl-D-alanine ligase